MKRIYGLYGPYQLKKAITDRTNRTVRGKGVRIVNKAFQSVKESVCDSVKLKEFVDPYGSYGPYELKMAIVRTVRFLERIYGS